MLDGSDLGTHMEVNPVKAPLCAHTDCTFLHMMLGFWKTGHPCIEPACSRGSWYGASVDPAMFQAGNSEGA